MRDDSSNPTDFNSEEAPEALIRDLKRLYQDEIPIPEDVDRAVRERIAMGEAPAPLAFVRSRRVWWTTGVGAVAAGMALIVWISGPQSTPSPPPASSPQRQLASGDMMDDRRAASELKARPEAMLSMAKTERADVDRNGRVNILDAFLVARAIESSDELNPAWDMTHDGSVGQADVQALAAAAVSLSRRAIQ